jgi:hypothetical protein
VPARICPKQQVLVTSHARRQSGKRSLHRSGRSTTFVQRASSEDEQRAFAALKAAGVCWLRGSDISAAMKQSKKRFLKSGKDQVI